MIWGNLKTGPDTGKLGTFQPRGIECQSPEHLKGKMLHLKDLRLKLKKMQCSLGNYFPRAHVFGVSSLFLLLLVGHAQLEARSLLP